MGAAGDRLETPSLSIRRQVHTRTMATTPSTDEPMNRQPTLVNASVELRPMMPDDFETLCAIAADPLLWEQHPSQERTQFAVFEEWFEDALASEGALTAIAVDGQEIIGTSRFDNYQPTTSEVEIGWSFLARSRWGSGLNGEIKKLMLKHAFQYVDTVVFTVHSQNMRSQRAVEKLGAVRTGSLDDSRGRGTNYTFRLDKSLHSAHHERPC
jgi:N-acetyltransferase